MQKYPELLALFLETGKLFVLDILEDLIPSSLRGIFGSDRCILGLYRLLALFMRDDCTYDGCHSSYNAYYRTNPVHLVAL